MAKSEDTQQTPVVKPDMKTETHPEIAVPSFAGKVEDLMNHAVQQSIPTNGEQATEHHSRFARWANHLGDLWREVKDHA